MERRYRFQVKFTSMVRNKKLPIFSCMLVAIHSLTHEVRRVKVQRPLSYPSDIVSERMDSNTARKKHRKLVVSDQRCRRRLKPGAVPPVFPNGIAV